MKKRRVLKNQAEEKHVRVGRRVLRVKTAPEPAKKEETKKRGRATGDPNTITYKGVHYTLPSSTHVECWNAIQKYEIPIPDSILKRTLDRWLKDGNDVNKKTSTIHCEQYKQRVSPADCLSRAWFFQTMYPRCKTCPNYRTMASTCLGKHFDENHVQCKTCGWSARCFEIWRRNLDP